MFTNVFPCIIMYLELSTGFRDGGIRRKQFYINLLKNLLHRR